MSKLPCLNPPAGRFIGWIMAGLALCYREECTEQYPYLMGTGVSCVLDLKISYVAYIES